MTDAVEIVFHALVIKSSGTASQFLTAACLITVTLLGFFRAGDAFRKCLAGVEAQ